MTTAQPTAQPAARPAARRPAPFALGVFSRPGDDRPFTGLVVGERVQDVTALGGVNELLADWDASMAALTGLAEDGDGEWYDVAALAVHCPVRPGQILQAGANYRRHVVDIVMAERRADISVTGHNSDQPEAEVRAWAEHMMDERVRTGSPYVFIGLPSALTGPYDDVHLPELGERHDWELELALVIGRPAHRIPRERAMEHVAAYTVSNDLTTRSLVYRNDMKAIGTDWMAAKNAPTFLPTGPYLVPSAFVPDPGELRITLRHNGVVRQDETTSDLLFDIPALLEYITARVRLNPGDLVLTGSPAGNGAHWGVFLADGDLLEGTVTGPGGLSLGTQRNRVVGPTADRKNEDLT